MRIFKQYRVPFLFLHGNLCCGYSLQASRRDASNEYTQHMLSVIDKTNIYKNASNLKIDLSFYFVGQAYNFARFHVK